MNLSVAKLKPHERAYWQRYVDSCLNKKELDGTYVTAGYAGSPEITDRLLELYLNGKKSAGSSVVEEFETAGDPLPEIGNHWIYLDGRGEPRLILRTEGVETHKFNDVPERIAIAEGEGDLSLEYWRRVHARLYTPLLSEWGLSRIEEATIITEHLKIVFRLD